jgi:hypothetical protein
MENKSRFDWSKIILVELVVLLFVVAACGPRPERKPSENPVPKDHLDYYVDTQTGCQYVRVGSGGITPRLNHNGFPMCGKKEN